jgi:hypothetical protein
MNTSIYPGSDPSLGGNSPTSSGLILMETCVTMGEQSASLVCVWKGSGSHVPLPEGQRSFIGSHGVP